MSITATPYGAALITLGAAGFHFTTDALKVMLTTDSYTPNVDTDDFRSDVTAFEVTGTGYSAGGVSLSGVTWTYDATNNRATLAADSAVWTTATFSNARHAVVYKSTGSAPSDPLLCTVDFGANQSPSGVDFTLDWSANGILRLTLA